MSEGELKVGNVTVHEQMEDGILFVLKQLVAAVAELEARIRVLEAHNGK